MSSKVSPGSGASMLRLPTRPTRTTSSEPGLVSSMVDASSPPLPLRCHRQRDRALDLRAAAGGGFHPQRAADRAEAVAHGREPRAHSASLHVEAGAVVPELEQVPARLLVADDPDGARIGRVLAR